MRGAFRGDGEVRTPKRWDLALPSSEGDIHIGILAVDSRAAPILVLWMGGGGRPPDSILNEVLSVALPSLDQRWRLRVSGLSICDT